MNFYTLIIFLLTFVVCSNARCQWKNNPSAYGSLEIKIATNDCGQTCCCLREHQDYINWCIKNCRSNYCRNGLCFDNYLNQCPENCTLLGQCKRNNNCKSKNVYSIN
jgi:hypothetical protein